MRGLQYPLQSFEEQNDQLSMHLENAHQTNPAARPSPPAGYVSAAERQETLDRAQRLERGNRELKLKVNELEREAYECYNQRRDLIRIVSVLQEVMEE
jgi:hypothetical protein